jgi:hypothetical protein
VVPGTSVRWRDVEALARADASLPLVCQALGIDVAALSRATRARLVATVSRGRALFGFDLAAALRAAGRRSMALRVEAAVRRRWPEHARLGDTHELPAPAIARLRRGLVAEVRGRQRGVSL